MAIGRVSTHESSKWVAPNFPPNNSSRVLHQREGAYDRHIDGQLQEQKLLTESKKKHWCTSQAGLQKSRSFSQQPVTPCGLIRHFVVCTSHQKVWKPDTRGIYENWFVIYVITILTLKEDMGPLKNFHRLQQPSRG